MSDDYFPNFLADLLVGRFGTDENAAMRRFFLTVLTQVPDPATPSDLPQTVRYWCQLILMRRRGVRPRIGSCPGPRRARFACGPPVC